MSRSISRSSAFVRSAKRAIKKQILTVELLRATLDLLAENPFDPVLKTHKLKGNLAGLWACSLGYDLRLVFEFVQADGHDSILLLAIGAHGEVY